MRAGSIDRWEIGELAKEMGRPMKEWELDEAMHIMDADGSGSVDYEEFGEQTGSNPHHDLMTFDYRERF